MPGSGSRIFAIRRGADILLRARRPDRVRRAQRRAAMAAGTASAVIQLVRNGPDRIDMFWEESGVPTNTSTAALARD